MPHALPLNEDENEQRAEYKHRDPCKHLLAKRQRVGEVCQCEPGNHEYDKTSYRIAGVGSNESPRPLDQSISSFASASYLSSLRNPHVSGGAV